MSNVKIDHAESSVQKESKVEKTVASKAAPPKAAALPKRNKLATKRVPLHKQKRIGIDKETDFYYRLVNDIDDRINSFKKAGYEIVSGKVRSGDKDAADAAQVGKIAAQQVGGGTEAYYMRIPLDIYNADQADKQSRIDRFEEDVHLDTMKSSVQRGKIKIEANVE